MNSTHDDLPHRIPPIAYLRYKENYFFVVLDAKANVFGVIHFNNEPLFNRIRISANLNVKGKPVRYRNEAPLPIPFELSPTIGDGSVSLNIESSHQRFSVKANVPEFTCDLLFEKRQPTFDFAACKYAAPERPSVQELMTISTNLPFEHIQQSMLVSGTVTSAHSGAAVSVQGIGYRDHSWGVRSDNIVSEHTWSGINFPDRAFGVMTFSTLTRPGALGMEGYVTDCDGSRALYDIDVEVVRDETSGGRQRLVIHRLKDIYGKVFTIESDLLNRFGDVPLAAEAPSGSNVYQVIDNFCPSVLVETGEAGISLVELGRSSALGGMID
jgi:hypothetical protein